MVVTASQTYSYVAQDMPAPQTVNQFSTTLIATLNGNQVFSETFGAQFGDPSVQAAILSANGLLTGDGATFGAPSLTSNSTNPLGSQLSYAQTGRQATGIATPTTSSTFGPAAVFGCNGGCVAFESLLEFPDLTLAPSGQLIINVNDDLPFAIDRTVITINTFLTTQTYDITGTTSINAAPEPSTWLLLTLGIGALVVAASVFAALNCFPSQSRASNGRGKSPSPTQQQIMNARATEQLVSSAQPILSRCARSNASVRGQSGLSRFPIAPRRRAIKRIFCRGLKSKAD